MVLQGQVMGEHRKCFSFFRGSGRGWLQLFLTTCLPFSFGASLSYASCDAKTAARSPQVLENALLADGVEIAIFSDKSCDDGGCGFTRPNNVAYREFFYCRGNAPRC